MDRTRAVHIRSAYATCDRQSTAEPKTCRTTDECRLQVTVSGHQAGQQFGSAGRPRKLGDRIANLHMGCCRGRGPATAPALAAETTTVLPLYHAVLSWGELYLGLETETLGPNYTLFYSLCTEQTICLAGLPKWKCARFPGPSGPSCSAYLS